MSYRWYYAYRHVNGTIHLKRHFLESPLAQDTIREAKSSSLVVKFLGPFQAKNRTEAKEIAKRNLAIEEEPTSEQEA